jgi:Spy/CpxP family protein refolding chaperone
MLKIDRFIALALAALVALPLAANVARAEPPGGRPPEGGAAAWAPPDARLEQQLRALGLDASQLEKTQAILADAKRTREEIDGRLQIAFEEMRTLLEQETPNEAAVMSQADRIGAIRTQGRKAMLRALLAVRADLTPAQREKLNEMMRRDGPPWRRGVHPQAPGPTSGAHEPATPSGRE